MKNLKILLPVIAVIFAVAGVFAMKANNKKTADAVSRATTLYFHYTPNTMSDAQYETAGNWQQSNPSEAGCDNLADITCLVEVTDADLAPYSGTQEQKFASFLADQSSPTSYVNQNLDGTKSAQ